HVRDALLDVGVRQRDAALDPIEHRGRYRAVTLGRVLIGDALDVIVDAEDLLHDDDSAARFALRLGEGCVEPVPVLCLERDHLPHDLLPRSFLLVARRCSLVARYSSRLLAYRRRSSASKGSFAMDLRRNAGAPGRARSASLGGRQDAIPGARRRTSLCGDAPE